MIVYAFQGRPTLCTGYNGRVQRGFVHIVTSQHVGYENAMKVGILQQSGQLDPMVDLRKSPRLVLWMPPEARRLMATA